jgi:hypothetical protein
MLGKSTSLAEVEVRMSGELDVLGVAMESARSVCKDAGICVKTIRQLCRLLYFVCITGGETCDGIYVLWLGLGFRVGWYLCWEKRSFFVSGIGLGLFG